MRVPFFVVMTLLFAACATSPRCVTPAVVETLYFGTAMPDGTISEDDWQSFLASVVAPRFPAGFTTWEATGQWRGINERTHILQVIHAPANDVKAITDEYKRRFRQEAVLHTSETTCVEY